MWVCSRKRGESIKINNDITITVLEIRNGKAILGIDASATVPVHRAEVWEAIFRPHASPEPPEVAEEISLKLEKGAKVRFTAEGGFFIEGPEK